MCLRPSIRHTSNCPRESAALRPWHGMRWVMRPRESRPERTPPERSSTIIRRVDSREPRRYVPTLTLASSCVGQLSILETLVFSASLRLQPPPDLLEACRESTSPRERTLHKKTWAPSQRFTAQVTPDEKISKSHRPGLGLRRPRFVDDALEPALDSMKV